MSRVVPVLIVFGKLHFLLISESEFFHEIKCNRITSLHRIHDHCIIVSFIVCHRLYEIILRLMYDRLQAVTYIYLRLAVAKLQGATYIGFQ